MNDNGIFAMRLRLRIAHKLLSQSKVAKITGIDRPLITKYVNGQVTPNARHLWRLCKALDCSADYLIGLSDYPYTVDKVMRVLEK